MTTETSNARGEVVTRAMAEAGWATGTLLGDTRVIQDLTAAYLAMRPAAPPPAAARGDVRGLVELSDAALEAAAAVLFEQEYGDPWACADADHPGGRKSYWRALAKRAYEAAALALPESALAAEGVQAGEVYVDFPQVGIAGPFQVEGGKVTLPDVTMNDLIHHARIGYVSQQPEARGAPIEPKEKPVGWWNGITPDELGRDFNMPSIRWGDDAEDSGHDLPLYAGYNPVHFAKPEARGVVDEAMVERAREAYFNAAEVKDGVFTDPVAMRAALTAALTGERNG